MSQEAAHQHSSIRHYLLSVETMAVDKMSTAELVIGEAYVTAMTNLLRAMEHHELWQESDDDREPASGMSIALAKGEAIRWQGYLEKRGVQMRKEIEARKV